MACVKNILVGYGDQQNKWLLIILKEYTSYTLAEENCCVNTNKRIFKNIFFILQYTTTYGHAPRSVSAIYKAYK